MKLKKLTIHNIASIADAELDFSQGLLADSPLFLICGQTGSGKSIILDAICLALFAQTPRMSRSVSSEGFEDPTANKNGEIKIKSNAQLMRRGTGECYARLVFEGNDGKDYEAEWELHRARNKASGNLGKETRLLAVLPDKTPTLTKKGDIEEKILEVVGMDFEQFCRTTLLAQGEFTRFLQCGSDDKAKILERLTGNEIYSTVGMKIFEKKKAAEDAYNKAKEKLEGIRLLTDEEKQEIDGIVNQLVEDIKASDAEVAKIDKKYKWLADDAVFKSRLKAAADEFQSLRQIVESDEFKARELTVAAYDSSASARAWKLQIVNSRSQSDKFVAKLPKLEESRKAAKTESDVNQKQLSEINVQIEELARKIIAIPQAKLRERQAALNGVKIAVHELRTGIKVRAEKQAELDRKKAQLAEVDKRLPAEFAEKESADKELVEADALYKTLEKTCQDIVKELRHTLRAGCDCPVCGQKVAEVPSDGRFESALEPVRQRRAEAEKRQREASAKLAVSEKEKQRLFGEIAALKPLLEKASQECKNAEIKAGNACLKAGVAFDAAKVDDAVVDNALADVTAQLRTAELLQRQKDEKQSQYNQANRSMQALNDKVAALARDVEVCKTNIANLQKSQQEAETNLKMFFTEHPDVSDGDLERLAALKPAEVEQVRKYCQMQKSRKLQAEGSVATLQKQVDAHHDNRPDIAENDSLESLRLSLDNKKALNDENKKQLTLRQKQLADDAELVKKNEQQRKEVDRTYAEWQRWEGLSGLVGDSEGKKFRLIAQSFILHYLLDIANGYLAQFCNRYRLTCQPGSLVILVEDELGSAPQGPNVLSGGESFMVSLSLALALSQLNAAETSADVLFIDEGFGTLSDDFLSSVMDSLETLRQIGGRRVGIISHVDELAARIPTQIQVKRIDAACSEVNVVNVMSHAN